MKRIYFKLIFSSMFIFVLWLFILAIRNNFDMSNVRINLFATLKRLENFSNNGLDVILNNIKTSFSELTFDFDFSYVNVNDVNSFFSNIGIWFNGVFNLITNFFSAVGVILKGIIDFIVFIINLIFELFNFIFNPVQL